MRTFSHSLYVVEFYVGMQNLIFFCNKISAILSIFLLFCSNMINYMEKPQSKSIIIKQDLLLYVANRIKSKHENEGKNPLKAGTIIYNQLFRVIFRALMVYKINIEVFFFFTQKSKIPNYCPSSTSHHLSIHTTERQKQQRHYFIIVNIIFI